MKSGLVAIVGRPSSGKSTLLNIICGYKVSIVSVVPQTTRNRIRGILTEERGQLVFLDTPGYHKSEKKMNLRMTGLVEESLAEADVILYVTDLLRSPGDEETMLLRHLQPLKDKVIAAMNKTDSASPEQTGLFFEFLTAVLPKQNVYPLSALTKKGKDELVTALFALTPEGPPYYPDDYYTDQDPGFRISEIIREQVFQRLKQEIPHSVFVEIADLEERDKGNKLWARAFIHVERDSQKGIVVGREGSIIKAIRLSAEKELGQIFSQDIHLDLRVKVSPKWRQNDKLLNRLIK